MSEWEKNLATPGETRQAAMNDQEMHTKVGKSD